MIERSVKTVFMKSEQSFRNGSWMRISMGSSQLVEQELLEKMEHLKPSFPFSIRQLMDLEKCLEAFLIKTLNLHTAVESLCGCSHGTFIFCLPGSPGACKDGWDFLIKDQLDSRTKPCNLVELMPRLNEE